VYPSSKTTTKKLSSLSNLALGQAQKLVGTRTVYAPVVPPILSYFNLNMKVATRATNLPPIHLHTVEKLRKDHFLAISVRGGHPPDPTCLR